MEKLEIFLDETKAILEKCAIRMEEQRVNLPPFEDAKNNKENARELWIIFLGSAIDFYNTSIELDEIFIHSFGMNEFKSQLSSLKDDRDHCYFALGMLAHNPT